MLIKCFHTCTGSSLSNFSFESLPVIKEACVQQISVKFIAALSAISDISAAIVSGDSM